MDSPVEHEDGEVTARDINVDLNSGEKCVCLCLHVCA